MMTGFLLTLLLKSLWVLALAWILPGVKVKGFVSAALVALVYGLLSAFVKPLMVTLAIPAVILSLGLFMFVINAALLWVTDKILGSFEMKGILPLALMTVGLTLGDLVIGRFF